MNQVFKYILDVCMVVYLDGTLIYSDNPDKHLKHVREGFATPSCKQPIRQSRGVRFQRGHDGPPGP
jgi:hypothetical protein